MLIERYAVHWVHLDPIQGSEMAKTRPAVIISDNDMNAILSTVVVCPITSSLHPQWPSRIQTTLSGKAAEIAVDQIRTVDASRLGERIGVLNPETATELRHIITIMYGVLAE